MLMASVISLLPPQAMAEGAYQSVGASGEVIFSDSKPADAVEVKALKLPPNPAPEAVDESRQRVQRMIERANHSQKQREAEKARKKSELEAAQQQLKEAETRLKETEEIREGDRLGTAGGGSRLTPGYFERVEAARTELEAAKKALKAARNR
jgi:hypothetical protein